MNIGDKVRLVHSTEEGFITKILKNDLVEIEIEAGFRMPILKKELAVVSSIEGKYFKKPTDIQSNQTVQPLKNTANKGIFFSFIPQNTHRLQLNIINNTEFDLPFCVYIQKDEINEGIGAGFLQAKSTQVLKEFDLQNFERWGVFNFQCFHYRNLRLPDVIPFSKKVKFRARDFDALLGPSPLLAQAGHVYQLDKDDAILQVNSQELKEKMLGGIAIEAKNISAKPNSIIDLHIEVIEQKIGKQSMPELQVQLNEFDKILESAIAHGLDEITFVHGVGNGILKQEIHRRLSKHKNVAFYKEAQKEKFGYGATIAKIK